ncbi:hypothetical protein M407DRAFT_24511 [Tulasnella calospora MUT 4182]|uniref:Uncharacterized protein n=1 Tax=Tulasnella calospora MUT 4182 TaxID=1051891 RepID=A0A0C3KXP5_9AGAM|nr:hypothetical protein M407DRAFT_24511 [Tulasnella calospora MUT 4182]
MLALQGATDWVFGPFVVYVPSDSDGCVASLEPEIEPARLIFSNGGFALDEAHQQAGKLRLQLLSKAPSQRLRTFRCRKTPIEAAEDAKGLSETDGIAAPGPSNVCRDVVNCRTQLSGALFIDAFLIIAGMGPSAMYPPHSPDAFAALQDAIHNSEFDDAAAVSVCDLRVTPDFTSKILRTLATEPSLDANARSRLVLRYVRIGKPPLQSQEDIECYLLALCGNSSILET